VDALGKVSDLGQCSLDLLLDSGQSGVEICVSTGQGSSQRELTDLGRQILLHAVMNVALDLPPLRLLRRDHTGGEPSMGDGESRL
jgi:hypothetical protein